MIPVKDANGNTKFFQTVGAGNSSDPFEMVNANISTERALGNLSGREGIFITGNNLNIGTTYTDINDFGGVEGFPSAAESLEILSSDLNDTALGAGARTILVTTLDADFVKRTQSVTMNGTTPVGLTGTHLRNRSIVVITAGTRTNIGIITLRVTGGGTTRLQMSADEGSSFSSLYTVPSGRSFTSLSINIFVPKNEDILLRSRIRTNITNGAWVSGATVPLYQNSTSLDVRSPLFLPEKNDILFQAKSTNTGVNVTVILEGEEIIN